MLYAKFFYNDPPPFFRKLMKFDFIFVYTRVMMDRQEPKLNFLDNF